MLKNENAFHKYHSDDLYSTGSIRLKDNGEQSHETPWVIILTHTYIFSNVKGVHKTSYLKKGCFEWLWVFVLLYYFRVIFILFSLVTCHWVIIFLDALMVLSITIRHVGLIQQNRVLMTTFFTVDWKMLDTLLRLFLKYFSFHYFSIDIFFVLPKRPLA